MFIRRPGVLLCVFLIGGLGAGAQEPQPEDVPCVIDDRLSLWLALESVDRTIAALEVERRELAADLATHLQALDILARAEDPDRVSLAETAALVQAKAIGGDAIEDAYLQVDNRLIDIDKTLTRRRKHQAMLEAEIEAIMESTPHDREEAGNAR